MSDPAESTTLYTQYTSKVDEDLAALEKEHEKLVARLALVKRDLELLRKVKAVISSGEAGSSSQQAAAVLQETDVPGPGELGLATGDGPGDVTVPPAVEEGTLQTPAKKATAAKKTAAKKTAAKKATAAKKTAAKKTAAKKTAAKKATAAKKTAAKKATAEPRRRRMILDYFAEVGQPRSSAEVTTELTQHSTEFTSSGASTRQTLEALVSQGKLERITQGRSVYYGPVTHASKGAAKKKEQTP